MSVKLSKFRHILFCAAICLTNILVMHDFVVLPVANVLYELFPDSVAGVNFILSGPAIIMFVSSLLVPYMLKFTSKKTLLSIACIVFTVSAIFEAAIVALPYMILTRSICGFCYGIVQVVALDIVADYFVDENKRASFMGIYNAAMALIGAVMGMVAGNLAVLNWKYAYYTYLIAIPMAILVVLFVPKFKQNEANIDVNEATESVAGEKRGLGRKFWVMVIDFIVFNICYTPMMTMAAVYIAENGIGNEATAGLTSSLGTIGSCVCCLAFGFLYSKLKARTSLISFVIMTLGLFAMNFMPGQIAFLIICAICGGAYGMLFSYVYAHVPNVVAPQNISRAISLLTAGSGLAMFSGTYVVTALMGIVENHTLREITLILGIVLAICFVIELLNTSSKKK